MPPQVALAVLHIRQPHQQPAALDGHVGLRPVQFLEQFVLPAHDKAQPVFQLHQKTPLGYVGPSTA